LGRPGSTNPGSGTFGHGAASAATLRIDPVNDLVIVMTRNAAGTHFDKYHPQFITAVVDGLAVLE
jgi:CubicO group peptidase (beta-lactamase class C family)